MRTKKLLVQITHQVGNVLLVKFRNLGIQTSNLNKFCHIQNILGWGLPNERTRNWKCQYCSVR